MQLPNYEKDQGNMSMRLFMLMKQGKAADWAQPHLERIASNHPKAIITQKNLAKAFNDASGDPDAARLAAQQIAALQQAGLVTDYTTSFKTLQSDLNWNEPALISQYKRGLQDHIKT